MNLKESVNSIQIMWAAVFIAMGTFGRYLLVGFGFQPFPNFEIIMVLTFLAFMLLKPSVAIFVPLLSMVFSDVLLGNSILVGSQMNKIVLFTYSGFTLVAVLCMIGKDRFKNRFNELRLKNVGFAAGLGIIFVLIYDVWTNIGWWYIMYPHNMQSLVMVFSAGIPFMLYHLISGVITFVVALPIFVYVSKKDTFDVSVNLKAIQKIPVVVIAVALIVLSFSGTATQVPRQSEFWLDQSDETSVRVVLIGSDWMIQDTLIAGKQETVFSALVSVTAKNNVRLEYSYHEQFDSFYIDLIHSDVNGENAAYWLYYVNHDSFPAFVAAEEYSIKNGDYIEWRFEVFS